MRSGLHSEIRAAGGGDAAPWMTGQKIPVVTAVESVGEEVVNDGV